MTSTATRTSTRPELRAYLALLAGQPRAGERLELRSRLPTGKMARRFYPATRPAGLVEAIVRLGARSDVYIGCAPRTHAAGGRDAIDRAWVLWADCDTPDAAAALDAIDPAPTLVITSGSPHARHAYWALEAPVGVDQVEDANRRLAHALGSDLQVYDAARILRPPDTRNFKHHPPAAVELVTHHPHRRYPIDDLLAAWPAPPNAMTVRSDRPQSAVPRRAWPRDTDPVLQIAPAVYLPELCGHPIDGAGKVPCPLHPDATASLHAYSDHWYCFGCRQGGTIYDLAGALWNLETRGPDFHELRHRLAARFTTPGRD